MIKKIFVIFIMLIFTSALAEEEVIVGGIKYNEASARVAAFKDLPRKIDRKKYKDYFKDPNKKENINSIKNETYMVDSRILCPFFLKDTLASYAVTYVGNDEITYYYNIFGNLIKFDITESHNDYERKIGYSRYGNLINVSFSASDDEQFVYDENGKLIAHWVGEVIIDKKAKFLKITRKSNNLTKKNSN